MRKIKLPQMLTGCLVLASIAITLLIIISICVVLSSCTSTAKANIPEKEIMLPSQRDARIINAYSALLHRVWIDKPSYVEDCLFETDEFLELDELLSGDWEDTFEFWNKQDSIEYKLNWNHVDKLLGCHDF